MRQGRVEIALKAMTRNGILQDPWKEQDIYSDETEIKSWEYTTAIYVP